MAAAPTAKRILLHIGAPVHDFEVLAAFHAQHDIPSTNHNSVPLHFHHYHPSRHFDPENYGPLLIDLHAQTQRDVDTGTVELEIYDVGLSIWVDDMDERNWLGENLYVISLLFFLIHLFLSVAHLAFCDY